MPKTKTFNLEESLQRLEDIVAKLESNTLSVDEMLKIYAEGRKVSEACKSYLEEAEQKIRVMREKDLS